VGEAPSNEEIRYGTPFVGPAGRVLNLALRLAGVDRKTVYVTNVVKCMSGRTPTWQEVKWCTDAWLWEELERVGPTTIVALGSTAWRAFHEDPRGIESWRGAVVRKELRR
jgi:DNA polymerase